MKLVKRIVCFALCFCMLCGNQLVAEAASLQEPAAAETVAAQPLLTNVTFDMDFYYNTNADLQVWYGYDYNELLTHYLTVGIAEGRWGSAEFNCLAYMNRYPDLQAAFGTDFLAYCVHYEQSGKAEGRNAMADGPLPEVLPTAVSSPVDFFVIGTYTTRYNPNIPRAINVTTAASRINGVIVAPGAGFSYSLTVLPRTPENGYVEAPVIMNGEYVPGYGGGICQVSSTLYAAMLTANLPATQRHPHSLPVSYVPVGMDATISGTRIDLQFVNIFDYPLHITAVPNNGVLTVTLSLLVPKAVPAQ